MAKVRSPRRPEEPGSGLRRIRASASGWRAASSRASFTGPVAMLTSTSEPRLTKRAGPYEEHGFEATVWSDDHAFMPGVDSKLPSKSKNAWAHPDAPGEIRSAMARGRPSESLIARAEIEDKQRDRFASTFVKDPTRNRLAIVMSRTSRQPLQNERNTRGECGRPFTKVDL